MATNGDPARGPSVSLTFKDFRLAAVQVVLFTPDEQVSGAKIANQLLPAWRSRFDGEPIVLPIDDVAPPEVPRVILSSKTGQWKCQISSRRFEIIWHQRASETASPPVTAMLRYANEYREFLRARVSRLAYVVNNVARHTAPGAFLARHFCREKWLEAPFNRPGDFELHAHKVFALTSALSVNSWVRNKTAQMVADGAPVRIVLVEQDLNTLAEEEASRAFTKREIAEFFRAATIQSRSILKLYYPATSGS